ncbi:hypothetical protein HDE_13582 [Halotydeus destructor]|nr:hypothetical protein HDE_13582 [Halotydeus destructor]
MACNAFGIMLGIFVVLFGLAYPEENFPGGYKGKETAGISGFFIIFTLIGYYGAHRQKVYFLVPYSVIIFLFLGGNLVMWTIKSDNSVLDPDSNTVYILGGVFLVLMVFALMLAWQEKRKFNMSAQHGHQSDPSCPQQPGINMNGMGKSAANQVNLVYQTGTNSYITVPSFTGIQIPRAGGPPIMY